ncbi:efflux RND transporter periplasmic adaptor subunit [Myxosarcina sp. GI1(2024)]
MQSNSSDRSSKTEELFESQDKQTKSDKFDHNGKSSNNSPNPKRPWLVVLGVALLIALGYGGWRWWQSRGEGSAPPAAQSQMRAAPVDLITLKSSTVRETSQFIGSLTSPRSVTISPEIEGRVSQIFVAEGDEVIPGEPLFQLRPDRQRAELNSLQAALNSARAARANALAELQSVKSERGAAAADVELQNQQYSRRQFLVEQGALAREELDLVERDRAAAIAQLNSLDDRVQAARANLDRAEAAVEEARANVEVAREQLQDTSVDAPFAGEVGNIIAKLGEYVAPGTPLTNVTQNDPLELELAIPVDRRSELRRGLPVELADTQGNPIGQGQITFISPQVNANSQTILTQARFPNPDGQLRDSQDVRARIVWDERQGILVPTTAVTRVGGQAFVYLATEPESQSAAAESETPSQAQAQPQLVARQVPVELGEIQNNNYPVLEGLQAGDRLIVSGILNLTDGAPIQPQERDRLEILSEK